MARSRICQFSSPQPHEWVKGKVIGSGSHCNVHLAINKANGELFVAKAAQSGFALQSLENEANILASLNSPHIVQYKGKDMSKGTNKGEKGLNVFMEYMAGGSLSDMADKFGGSLDEEVIRLYTKQVLYGLKYLHKNGIVHCDLKCQNVLVGLSGNVKLGDFRCAKRVKVHENEGKSTFSWQSVVGTPLWMAPEVLRNEGMDFAADIWSLGCTVNEMATGRPPNWGTMVSNPMAAVLKIACSNGKTEYPIHFSDEGLDFFDKCLATNPKRRWTADELLDHPFVSEKKFAACSPASVLHIRIYDQEPHDSDESESPNLDGYLHINPFSTRQSGERTVMVRRVQTSETDFRLSDDWITVRSG